MENTSDIIRALGAKKIASAVGVRHESAVYNAASSGRFPASWYLSLRDMCVEGGHPCPESLFNWKSSMSTSSTSEVAQ
jgi:hypothetical protein